VPNNVRIEINKGKMDALMNKPSGEVGREIKKRAQKVARAAKVQVGVKTGRLRRSIRVYDHKRYVKGQSIKIGASAPYALYHHNGTRQYVIRPKNGGFLKFPTAKGFSQIRDRSKNTKGSTQMYAFARSVVHKRVRPNRFLTDNIKYLYTP
jgi:hypothetical protein